MKKKEEREIERRPNGKKANEKKLENHDSKEKRVERRKQGRNKERFKRGEKIAHFAFE